MAERSTVHVSESALPNHCFLTETEMESIPALREVPKTVWASSKYDVGLIKNCDPIQIIPKSDYRPCKPQYPLKREAIEGIKPVFEALKKAGVIVECENSPVRTPIFPVKKIRDADQPVEWRFVQDLQAVNDAVQTQAPIVPNPYTLLSQIPGDAEWFSVVDLSNAFFSVPVHKDSQFWFAFNFNGKPYTFTRLCQGFKNSPVLFGEALKRSLETLQLTPGSALIQYVDDLLITARDEETCTQDTVKLLKHSLAAMQGFATPEEKKQWVKAECKLKDNWVEVFPTSKQNAGAVAKALVSEIVPRWGIPKKISSDNGTPFANEAIDQISQQVKDALPKPAEGFLHDIRPGDFVVVKDFRRKHWKSRRWNGPFQVLLITHTAVKVAERATWIHASHCKKVPPPPEGDPTQ
ncbi:uncharacterized protein LOC122340438 [Puntigrus tetrazona]|uniref:uncharacterized protein LOC122340438 n=1 Tax=Puntigrus tetrazona TaxID=1606681 RepID=UPI001C891CF6|nr:uncharacterized protein LOC122340438 [Puntigrus tetrazona]